MSQETTQWSQMATSMMETWLDTHNQIWKNWFELMGSVPSVGKNAPSTTAFSELNQRIADNQQLLSRFLQLSFKAWQDIFPQVKAGESWQDTLNSYSQKMKTQLEEFAKSSLKTTEDRQKLWELYLKEVQNLNQLWIASLGAFFQPMNGAMAGTSEPWIELNNLYWKLFYDESFSKYWQMPLTGPTREFSGKLLKGFDAWAELYHASQNYQLLLADIQVHSFEALMEKLVKMAEKGEIVTDWQDFQRIWTTVADTEFEKAFCQEKNLKVRGQFLNALNKYRIQQQDLQEIWLKSMNMPSRGEVDEMHKTIYELRKEVKSLKKMLSNPENEG